MFDGMTTVEVLKLIAPILVVQFLLIMFAIYRLVKDERVRFLPKWAWALVIVFVSTIGPIIYLMIGRERD